jgi:hypothetical protein
MPPACLNQQFGKRYTTAITMAQDRGVQFINLDWSDNATFSITEDLPVYTCTYAPLLNKQPHL